MKKLLLLGALMATSAIQAQTTFYWPGQRATTLTDNTDYFIYNTAFVGASEDRTNMLYSNGTKLAVTKAKPSSFYTNNAAYLFTAVKPNPANSENHWYLKSIHGNVGIGGQTNNTEIRDLYITPWTSESVISKADSYSEAADGTVNADPTKTQVWTISKTNEANPNAGGNTNDGYAWNGNANEWATWCTAHPYAFYSVESKTLNSEASAYYNELNAKNGKFADIAFLLQKHYGLVQDGNLYYSNYKSTKEGSYEALIDGNDGSYFHSAYGDEAGTDQDPKHYLRAEIQNPTTAFYIITKRRCDNNNNRPTNILVEGCNEADGEYSTIKTLEGLPTDANEYFYFSDIINAETAYKYIRFTPQTINTGTRFFTYSEFYIIPATKEITAVIETIKALNEMRNANVKDEAFTSETLISLGTAFDKACEEIKFAQAKDDANALISTNASNHTEDPALGQYPTESYNALQTALTTETTSEGLENAIKAFKFSINAPVFTINGAFDGETYKTLGKSIYYTEEDAAAPYKWNKATNKYDKAMLWKFAGMTSSTPELNKTYSIMNLSEEVYLFNIENMQLTQTNPENENNIIIIKPEGANPIHADGGGSIVDWNNYASNSASAWTIEYIGESKNIEKIDAEDLTTYAELKNLVSTCEKFEGKIGEGLNKFTCKDHDFGAALTAAKAVLDQDIYENPTIDAKTPLDALKAAKEALTINQPETGKFYRIKSVLKNKYVTSNQVAGEQQRLAESGTDNTTVFYLSADNHLTCSTLCNMSLQASTGSNLGTTYEFLTNNNGYYMIKATDIETPLYAHTDPTKGDVLTYDFNGGAYADRLANAWTLEEVTDAAQQFSLKKEMTAAYATLAAPVALKIPAGVEAYTVTVDATDAENAKAILTEVTDVIPAGVAVVLKKTGTENSFDFTLASEGATENENALVGVYTATNVNANTNAYILGNGTKGIGFYQMDGTDRTLAANKAYLELSSESNAIRSIIFSDGTTTGIESTVAEGTEAEEYYDLQGRRVMNPTKGIYVTKSGKKVVINK